MRWWTRLADSRVAPFLVAAAVLAVYLPSAFSSGLVSDDLRFIRDNPHVTNPDGAGGWLALLWDPRTVDPASPTGIVRPLRTVEFALDYALFRLSPTAFHIHSILWHALASMLAFGLFRRLGGHAGAALAGALIWALHPLSGEAVSWISSRGDVAMGACVLGALLLELRSGERTPWGGLLLGLVAMLYKETAVVLPLLVFAVRLVAPPLGPPGRLGPALNRAARWAAVAAAYLMYRSVVQVGDTAHAETFVLGGSTAGTFATMFRGFGLYLTSALVPVAPAWDWYLPPTASLFAPSALAWLAVHAVLIGGAFHLRQRAPVVAAAACLFYFPLIPVANWPFTLGIPTAERFLYLPLLGLGLLAARGLTRAPRATPAAIVGILALAVASFSGTSRWSTAETLVQHSLSHGTSPRAHTTVSAELRTRGVAARRAARKLSRSEEPAARAAADAILEAALDHAHQALDLWHRAESARHSTSHVVVVPHVNAADLCLMLDRPGEALWHAERAIAAGEALYPESHYNRARALISLRRGAGALRAMERAVELGFAPRDPAAVRVFRGAGALCLEAKQYELARVAYTASGNTDPRGFVGVAEVDRTVADLLALEGDDAALLRVVTQLANGEPVASPLAPPGTPLHAIHALVCRGTPEGWRAAEEVLRVTGDAFRAALPVRRFWRAVCLEELGRDDEALAAFESIEVPRGVWLDRERIRLAVERLREGCPAWRDHGPDAP